MLHSEEEKEELKVLIHSVLDERTAIDHNTHKEHHQVVAAWIEKNERWQQRREKVIQHVLGWGAVIGVATIGKAIYEYFQNHS